MSEKRFCTRCGGENSSEFEYCVFCGESLSAPAPRPAEPCSANACNTFEPEKEVFSEPSTEIPATEIGVEMIGSLPADAVSEFVGTNQEKVLPNMKRAAEEGTGGFNFVAFLLGLGGFPFIYFFYRKMYKVGALLFAVCLAIYSVLFVGYAKVLENSMKVLSFADKEVLTIAEYNTMTEALSVVLLMGLLVLIAAAGFIVVAIIVGKKANMWYYKHIVKSFDCGLPPSEVIKKGGTNKVLAIVSAIVWYVAIESVIFALLIPFMSEYMNFILTMSI